MCVCVGGVEVGREVSGGYPFRGLGSSPSWLGFFKFLYLLIEG